MDQSTPRSVGESLGSSATQSWVDQSSQHSLPQIRDVAASSSWISDAQSSATSSTDVRVEAVTKSDEDVILEAEEAEDTDEDEYRKVKVMLKELKMTHLYDMFEENCIRDRLLDIDFADLKDMLKECGLKIGQITEIKLYLKKDKAKQAKPPPPEKMQSPEVLIPPAQFESSSTSSLPLIVDNTPPNSSKSLVNASSDIFKKQKDDLSTLFLPPNSDFNLEPTFSLPPHSFNYNLPSMQPSYGNDIFNEAPILNVDDKLVGSFNRSLWSNPYDNQLYSSQQMVPSADSPFDDLLTFSSKVDSNNVIQPNSVKSTQSRTNSSDSYGLVDFQTDLMSRKPTNTSFGDINVATNSSTAPNVTSTTTSISNCDTASSQVQSDSFDPMSVFKSLFDSPVKDLSEIRKNSELPETTSLSGIARSLFSGTSGSELTTTTSDKNSTWSFDLKDTTVGRPQPIGDETWNQNFPAVGSDLSKVTWSSTEDASYLGETTSKSKTVEVTQPDKGFFTDQNFFDKTASQVNPRPASPWSASVPVIPSSAATKVTPLMTAKKATTVHDFAPAFTANQKKSAANTAKTTQKPDEKVPSYADAIGVRRLGFKTDVFLDKGLGKKGGMTVLGKVSHGSTNRSSSEPTSAIFQREISSVKKTAWTKPEPDRLSWRNPPDVSKPPPIRATVPRSPSPVYNPRAYLLKSPDRVDVRQREELSSTGSSRPGKQGMRHMLLRSSIEGSPDVVSSGGVDQNYCDGEGPSQPSEKPQAENPTVSPVEQQENNWWSPEKLSNEREDVKKSLEQEVMKTFSKANYYGFDTSGSDDYSDNDDEEDGYVIVEKDNPPAEPTAGDDEFPTLSAAMKMTKNQTKSQQGAPPAPQPVVPQEPTTSYAFGSRNFCVLCGSEKHLSFECPDKKKEFFFN